MTNNKSKIKTDSVSIVLFILVIVWMAFIFYMSAQTAEDSLLASGSVSDLLTRIANGLYKGNIPEKVAEYLQNGFFVRKAGHIIEFFILGILVYALLRRQGVKKSVLLSIMVCVAYAASDEIHQMFVPNRGPLVTDVLIDGIASAAAVLLMWLPGRISVCRSRRISKTNSNSEPKPEQE